MILWTSIAFAAYPTNLAVHGWERSEFFVVETTESSHGEYSEEAEDGEIEQLVYGDRFDVWGERHRTLIRHQNHEPAEIPGPTNESGWSEWLAGREFSNATSTQRLGADVELSIRSEFPGEWADGVWRDAASSSSILTLGVKRDGGGWWPLHTVQPGDSAFGIPKRTIRTYPSPDGRWVAVDVHTGGLMTMRGPTLSHAEWTIHQVRPLVSVLAPEGARQHARAVVEILSKPGNGLIQAGVAQAAREQTVVYFREGFESDAQRIDRQLGSGVTREPMTWEGPQDIVVALGPPPEATD